MDSRFLLVPGASTFIERNQNESDIVAWVKVTTFSTLLGEESTALNTLYDVVGRLCRFNSCVLSLPFSRLVSATSSTLSKRFFTGFFLRVF